MLGTDLALCACSGPRLTVHLARDTRTGFHPQVLAAEDRPVRPDRRPAAGSGRSPGCRPRSCGRPRSPGTGRHGPWLADLDARAEAVDQERPAFARAAAAGGAATSWSEPRIWSAAVNWPSSVRRPRPGHRRPCSARPATEDRRPLPASSVWLQEVSAVVANRAACPWRSPAVPSRNRLDRACALRRVNARAIGLVDAGRKHGRGGRRSAPTRRPMKRSRPSRPWRGSGPDWCRTARRRASARPTKALPIASPRAASAPGTGGPD